MNGRANIISVVFLLFAAVVMPAQAAENKCLKYEPATIELTGNTKRVTFPGPPNYESIEEGDKPERYWVLYLPNPICVDGDPDNEMNEAEQNVRSLQLIIRDYDKYNNLLGRKVTVTGELMHGFTGHHHTDVLVNVKDMKKALQ